jgi:proteasome lid subunit RPN8/RPN11
MMDEHNENNFESNGSPNVLRGDGLPVYREKPLPKGELRGRFLIARSLIEATREALTSIALEGIKEGGHEGLVYWAGRDTDAGMAFLAVVVPESNHGPQRVMVDGQEVTCASKRMRARNLGLKAQVHSHPGGDARHSDGDDDLILMPFEGMLSVVAPDFGIEVNALGDLTVHQYQDGRWVLCSPESVERNFEVIPTVMDVRRDS